MDANTKDVLMFAITTIPSLAAGYFAYKAGRKIEVVSGHQEALVANVEKIEKATNSMKDALVAATAKSSHAEGVKDEKAAQAGREGEQAKGGEAERAKSKSPGTP